MLLVIGLGNQGEKYQNTRHNAGRLVLKALAQKIQSFPLRREASHLKFKNEKKLKAEILETELNDEKIILARPTTFMNQSGQAVKLLTKHYALDPRCLFVIYDDLDIHLGQFKIQFGKGPKVHQGLESIEKALKTKYFWRVRIGIENRDPQNRLPGEKYVLSNFKQSERPFLEKVFQQATDDLLFRLSQQHL